MESNNAISTLPAIGTLTATRWTTSNKNVDEKSLATIELQYLKAVSLYRRRAYDKCVELCTIMLQDGHQGNNQMFSSSSSVENGTNAERESSTGGKSNSNVHLFAMKSPVLNEKQKGRSKIPVQTPTWVMEGVWQMKMRALTQRVYVDDFEGNDDCDAENEIEYKRIATAARPGTCMTKILPRPRTTTITRDRVNGGTHSSTKIVKIRPSSGIERPGTSFNRPGSSLGNRPWSRCGTASRVRAMSATAFKVNDSTAPLYQASRLNPTIYAERVVLIKSLFQFLFYHESDVQKAYSLCEAVIDTQKQKHTKFSASSEPSPTSDWWWIQQMGRALLAMRYPRKAELYLQQSLAIFPHPETYLLLSRVYQTLKQPDNALKLINRAVDQHPFDLAFRLEQANVFDTISDSITSLQIRRLIVKLNPINIESLACIALSYFYDNNPEMAIMYYRRILSLGVHSAELYCNIALCCLYGGQIDLVLPCFQRSLLTCKSSEQKAAVWYNLSFVAITTGDFNLARRCLQLCLTSDARYGAALNNLAVLTAQTGNLLKAKTYLTAAKEILPESEEVDNNLKYMNSHFEL